MSRLALRLAVGVLLGFGVLVGFAVYADLRALGAHLAAFTWWILAPVLGLTLLNYTLRFLKWQLLLGRAEVRVPPAASALVFLSGFSMGITPGKVGELLKAWLLKGSHGVPMTRTAPVVIAERITDLVALVILCLGGAFVYVEDPRFGLLLAACGLVVVGLTAVLASARAFGLLVSGVARLPFGAHTAPRLRALGEPLHQLLSPGPLAIASLVSVAAWLCECLGFWLVIRGLPGAAAPLPLCVFIYAATTVLGALSFLPGGLGVTEGSMTLLLVRSAAGLTRSGAVAATVLIRLCTLWFGVCVGFVALGLFKLRAGVGLPR